MNNLREIDDYLAAVQPLIDDARKKYDRETAQEYFEQKITDAFPEQMARAYKECGPSDLLRQRHQKLFAQFREAMIADKLSFLPAAPATVFAYLLDEHVTNKRGIKELRKIADAIQYFHHLAGHHVDSVMIEAAINVVNDMSSPDGGSKAVGGLSAPASVTALAADAHS